MDDREKARFSNIFRVLVDETRAASGDGDGVLILKNYCPQKGEHDPSLLDVSNYFEEWCAAQDPHLCKHPYNHSYKYSDGTLRAITFWLGEETITITIDKDYWAPNWGPDVKIEVW